MIDLADLGVVILSGVAHATLQLGLGCLLLLYHASLGKHVRKKTKNLVGSFISGVGLMNFLILASACFIIAIIANGCLSPLSLIVITAIITLLAIIMWFFYYRRGRTTELWLPKIVARYIDKRAKLTESNTEAFSLGLLACFAEMPFTLVLMLVSANAILCLPEIWQGIAVALYTITSILPLIIMRYAIRRGGTVVDIQRWRNKNKNFLRMISGVLFLILGIYIIAFKVIGQ
ncbi:hypothetical protein IJI55_01270 [Candidatus Saccharibacteria bacterium]|nr:hypothetical protein [Candidatus Saccharibacteria bacterium]